MLWCIRTFGSIVSKLDGPCKHTREPTAVLMVAWCCCNHNIIRLQIYTLHVRPNDMFSMSHQFIRLIGMKSVVHNNNTIIIRFGTAVTPRWLVGSCEKFTAHNGHTIQFLGRKMRAPKWPQYKGTGQHCVRHQLMSTDSLDITATTTQSLAKMFKFVSIAYRYRASSGFSH